MSLSVAIRKRLGNFSLDVQFEAGDAPLALFGASGCGKSVTLKCIAGILRPDEGRIVLDFPWMCNLKRAMRRWPCLVPPAAENP